MRNRFDQQLEKLNVELVTMGALCEDALTYAIRALFDRESDMAERAEEAEKQIDQMEREIEAICMRLLLQQQPVARDLRVISSALKMIGDMERIGDQAADIAEIVKYLKEDEVPNLGNLREMSDFAAGMVTASINSFVRQDLDLARKVILDDDVVDGCFDKAKRALIRRVTDAEADGEYALDLLMIAKYFERIGDHAVNIAQWVRFSIAGSREEDVQ